MIFQRAALREFATTAGAIFLSLFFIVVTVILIRLLSQAAGGRLPPDAVLALIGFSTLNHLPVVLSLSLFLSILLVMTRSYRDSEMVVWFASGLPLTAWLSPVLRFALPVAALVAGLSLFLSPWAQGQAAEYRKRLAARDEATRVVPGAFSESAGARRVFFVESVSPDEREVRNVFVSTLQGSKVGVVVAARGHVETMPNGDRFVVLEDGRRYEGRPGEADYRVLRFERYALRLEPREIEAIDDSPKLASTPALLAAGSASARGELVWRVGLPLAALVLALLAVPLSFVNPRAGRGNNLIFALLGFSIYANLLGVAQAWVGQGKLDFLAGLLGVHGVMLLLTAALFRARMGPSRPAVLALRWRRK